MTYVCRADIFLDATFKLFAVDFDKPHTCPFNPNADSDELASQLG